jgi:hypothetical protein
MAKSRYHGMTIQQVVFDIQKRITDAGYGKEFHTAVINTDYEKLTNLMLESGGDQSDLQWIIYCYQFLQADFIKNLPKRTGHQEYRADVALYNRWLVGSLATSVPLFLFLSTMVINAFIHRISVGVILVSAFLAVLLGAGVYATMKYLISKAVVTTDKTKISYRGVFGVRHVIKLDEPIIGILTYYQQDTPISMPNSMGALILKNASKGKHSEIRLIDAYYDFETLAYIANLAGVEYVEGTHVPKEINKLQPGLMRFSELHPIYFVLIVLVIVLGIPFAAIALFYR